MWSSVKFRKHGISGYAGELLRCAVLEASLYNLYYLGFCAPYASHFIPLAHLFRASLTTNFSQNHNTWMQYSKTDRLIAWIFTLRNAQYFMWKKCCLRAYFGNNLFRCPASLINKGSQGSIFFSGVFAFVLMFLLAWKLRWLRNRFCGLIGPCLKTRHAMHH